MLDILQDHLVLTTTPELLAVLKDAHALFERVDLQDYEGSFEELLMVSESEIASDVDTVTAIHTLTRELLARIINEHGVYVTDEITTEHLVQVLTGLLDIQNYGDADQLVRTCTMEGTPEETFAELMPLVTNLESDELLMHLAQVDLSVIVRIREMAETQQSYAIPEDQDTETYIAKLRKFIEAIGGERIGTTQLVQQGLKVGMSFETYVAIGGADFETFPDDKIAKELMAMAIISRDGSGNPRGAIKPYLETLVHDMARITRIDVAIGDLMLKMN